MEENLLQTMLDAELGVNVSHNHFHGTSYLGDLEREAINYNHDRDRVRQDVSFFSYPSIEEGVHILKLMNKYKGVTNCNYHYLARIDNLEARVRGKVVLITEQLIEGIDDWIKRYNTMYEQVDRRILGLGEGIVSYSGSKEFLKTFRPIVNFLQMVHGNDNYHGRLGEGTFFHARDKKVCFAHFEGSNLTQCDGIRKDFNDLVILIQRACGRYLERMPCEWTDFKFQVSQLPQGENITELRDACWFLYNHPLFWTAAQTRLFVDKLWNLHFQVNNIYDNTFSLDHADDESRDIGEWWNKLPPSSRGHSRLWHDVYNFKPRDAGPNYVNPYKGQKRMIAPYIRNALHHNARADKKQTMRHFRITWPHAIMVMFREIQHIVLTTGNVGDELKRDLLQKPTPFVEDPKPKPPAGEVV